MKGAIIFLIVFALVVVVTFAYVSLPPGETLYNAVLPNTKEFTSQYALAGSNAFVVIVAVFNGVIYAFIAWLIFTLVTMGSRKKDKQNVNVNVTVNNDKSPPPPQPAS